MKRTYALMLGLVLLLSAPGVATAAPKFVPQSNQQYIDLVIQRALSQRGVPFVYGGGNVNGPSASSVPRPVATPEPAPAPAPVGLPGLNLTVPAGPTVPTALPTAAPDPAAVGFDASGLIQYAFAGVGIKLPRSSGEQYKVGRKVLPSQALPGDLIFYGPEGTQSVALFIGNGQMVEATDPAVTVSPVRTNTMTPYLTRLIDR